MAFEIRPHPEWSWSQSRRCSFRDCKRMYYWQYYGAHNGWLDAATGEAKLAYRLKQITNLHLVLGDAVDGAAKRAAREMNRGVPAPTAEALYEECSRKLSAAWKGGRDRAAFERKPKYNPMLHEFYYGPQPSETLVEEVKAKLRACCENLPKTDTLAEVADPGARLLEVPDFTSFQLHGTRVFAMPDQLYRRGDGAWIVVDWKTGKIEDEHLRQVRTYALWLKEQAEYDGGPMRVRLEYLLTGKSDERALDDAALAEESEAIARSMEEMKAFLADPALNAPKDKSAFPLTEDRFKCRTCNYFELCEEELRESGAGV